MKAYRHTFAALGCAILTTFIALAQVPAAFADTTWVPVYAADFTTDPGWTTNTPGSYFWNSDTGDFTLTMVNGSESYVMNPVSLDATQSFKFEFDINTSRMDSMATVNFGLYSANDPGLTSPSDHPHLVLEFGKGTSGNILMVEGYDATDHFIQFYQYPSSWTLGTAYHGVVIYDHDTGVVTGLVTNKSEGQLVWSGSQLGVSGFDGLAYLGASKVDASVNPGATGVAVIDNVVISQPGSVTNSGTTVTCAAPQQAECGTPVVASATIQDDSNAALSVQWFINGSPGSSIDLAAGTTASPVTLYTTNTYPVGTNFLTVIVTDAATNMARCVSQIIVTDTQPPDIKSIAATPNVLWPANHKWRGVDVVVDAEDCSAFTWRIKRITSNETANGRGDGRTCGDSIIVGPHKALLRAGRSGRGAGRVYMLTIEATDAFGNSSTGIVQVTVPHDMGRNLPP